MKGKIIIGLLIACALASRAFGGAEQIRFLAMDVLIDPKGQPLAAYQLEIAAPPGVKIVGVEGGEHPEFRKAPYYDPKAIQNERVIVAAFTTAEQTKLPRTQTRVLTLHLESVTTQTLKLETTLRLTATPNGQKISSDITISERKAP
jgi:hypothetical protein